MAVKDGVSYYPTERLVSKKSRSHYRISVRSQHWQLRSLIGADKQDLVYFPGGPNCNHVQRLNTTTNETETIKLLPFSPRCLVARHGWVCCGGETGEFAVIRVPDTDDTGDDAQTSFESNDLDIRPGSDSESQPPRDFESFQNQRTGFEAAELHAARLGIAAARRNLAVKPSRLARDRVNCVTLWFPPPDTPHEAYQEPVAVLSNNDKTVVLVALNGFEDKDKAEPLDTITYPDYVNRALISPDGSMLVAVLDDPYLYVHRRVRKHTTDPRPSRQVANDTYQWEECNKILLKSQQRNDPSNNRGSFAACFSPSGTHLAVGTQYGYISIFDAKNLDDPAADPLLTTFTSSRPDSAAGAIRDMAFCPGPFDILAWTEDRGRVGLADVRTGFVQQQVIDISSDGGFERILVFDRNFLDPHSLEGRGERNDHYLSHLADLSTALGINDETASRRPVNAGSTDRHGLTPDETLVLEALQFQRRRREQGERLASRLSEQQSQQDPTSSDLYASLLERSAGDGGGRASGSGEADSTTSVTAGGSGEAGSAGSLRERNVTRAFRELRDAEQEREERGHVTRALSDWLRASRERSQERMRALQRQSDRYRNSQLEMQRRANYYLVSPPRATATRNDRRWASNASRGTADTEAAAPLPPPGGWSDLEALYNISLMGHLTNAREGDTSQSQDTGTGGSAGGVGSSGGGTGRDYDRYRGSTVPYISSVAIRDRIAAARTRLSFDADAPGSGEPEPDNTAGISWSQNGRTLFVGAENGIYEFHVDIQGRKYCSNISLR